MEAPGWHGLGRRQAVDCTAALTTAPASPLDEQSGPSTGQPLQSTTSQPMASTMPPPPHTTVGHFSYGPATQQTVVTTTTTTTVSFPPLLIRPPRDLDNRDVRQYPLAFSPTPNAMKRFCVDVGGRPTLYKEADDADAALKKVRGSIPYTSLKGS